MDITKKEVKAWVRQQAAKGRRKVLGIVFLSLLDVGIAVVQAWLLADILSVVLLGKTGNILGISHPIGLWLVASLCRAVLLYSVEVVSGRVGVKAQRDLRASVLGYILQGGPALLRHKHTAALTNLVIDQVEVVDGFFSRWLPVSILWVAAPALILGIIVFIQPWVAVVLGVCGLVIPLAQAIFGIGAALAARKQFLAMARLQTRFLDRIRGIATLVFLGRINQEAVQLHHAANELRSNTMRILRVAFLSSATIDCVMIIAIIVIATSDSMVLYHIFHGHFRMEEEILGPQAVLWVTHAIFALLLIPEFFSPFRSLALAYQDRAHITSAGEEILPLQKAYSVYAHKAHPGESLAKNGVALTTGLLSPFQKEENPTERKLGTGLKTGSNPVRIRPALTPTAEGQTVLEAAVGAKKGIHIEFRSVSFSWEEERGYALEQISLVMPAETTTILSGPSGAGKTTFMELLLGFIAPQFGQILFNGIDTATLTAKENACLVSWIGQHPVLFAGTLRENIIFANPQASQSEVEQALQAAGIFHFLADLPHGLDTFVGEGGYGLSGGQAQRVAIARAYLKNTPILLLDEPTTALDPHTEQEILASLQALAVGKTVIIVSHSPAVRAMAGLKVYLQNGRLVTAPRLEDRVEGERD
ncbi:ABC transporter ATP-binding protein/permease [Entomobacter blattae]|uniref:Vitamin B12 import ATP-binding protein BtuD n=1 Tax=Entomobacter blattae TaxID=2762277 RepID=A0A7H1NS31_9PROT|nr:ATP-binding cassette domain-containing protein [Entomobacter blattae]QNT78591.1 Vitamin B12 import ATP-binding protein BtuD [Entomobacter blattae]